MSNSPVIFDVDGVLADFVLGFTRLAADMGFPSRVYGTGQQEEWEELGGLSRDEISRVWDRIKQDKRFWMELDQLTDWDETARIWKLGQERPVYFVTARVGRSAKYQTERWLEVRGFAYTPTVILASAKGDVAAAVRASHLIDDKAGNAVYTAYASPLTQSYVIDRPYNQFDPVVIGSKVRRVKTVTEFLDEIERG